MISEHCKNIVCKQEVSQLGIDSISHFGYKFQWTGQKEKRQYGIRIAICKSSDIVTDNILYQSESLLAADIIVQRDISLNAPIEKWVVSEKVKETPSLKQKPQTAIGNIY